MLAAIASAALIVAGSLAVGQAVLRPLRPARVDAGSPGPVGLAAAAGRRRRRRRGSARAARRWPSSLVALVAAGIATIVARSASSGELARAGAPPRPRSRRSFAAFPFIAAGRVGILGVGLVNDDMASHLLLADWIDERFRPEPVLIDQGYPARAARARRRASTGCSAPSSIDVFAGLDAGDPGAHRAGRVLGARRACGRGPRVAAAALVALPYLAAAYLAQEAFKEPIMALFLLDLRAAAAAANATGATRSRWACSPPGPIYVYSFPGLAWLAGVALVWGRDRAAVGRSRGLRSMDARTVRSGREALPTAIARPAVRVAVASLVAPRLPELGRLADFADFRALAPRPGQRGRARQPARPALAAGGARIWPTSEFRLSAAASSLPAVVFYAGGAARA